MGPVREVLSLATAASLGTTTGHADSEPWWSLHRDGESALECKPDASESALVEELPYQSNAVGHAARGREFWERIFRIGGPVRARLGDFDEAGAERERGMTGLVANGQHFV